MAKRKGPLVIHEFDDMVKTLSGIVKELEKGDVTLEESLAHFEKGIQLVQQCQKFLSESKLKVEQLTQNDSLAPFAPDEGSLSHD